MAEYVVAFCDENSKVRCRARRRNLNVEKLKINPIGLGLSSEDGDFVNVKFRYCSRNAVIGRRGSWNEIYPRSFETPQTYNRYCLTPFVHEAVLICKRLNFAKSGELISFKFRLNVKNNNLRQSARLHLK